VANGSTLGKASAGLAADLRRNLEAGSLKGDYLPSVRQICKLNSVSIDTTMRALRSLESEGLVVAEPRKGFRILAGVNNPAKGAPIAFVLSRENIIGGWDHLYRALEDALQNFSTQQSWELMSLICSRKKMKALFERLKETRAWGVIFDSSYPEVQVAASRAGLPLVAIDHWSAKAGYDAVVQDNFNGASTATEYLLKKGRQKIAWFGPTNPTFHTRTRFGGAAAALSDAGLAFSHTIKGGLYDPGLRELARELLSNNNPPDGLLTLWRPHALAVSMAARDLNLQPGKDFDFVGWCAEETLETGFRPGFGDQPLPATITWSAKVMAETAVNRLLERRRKPDLAPVRITVATQLQENITRGVLQ
jgi:DNA-binding LacI/PurR family transcriptional regulator